jgi:hypothetical protein
MMFVRKVLEVIGACVFVLGFFVFCYTPLHSSHIKANDAATEGFKKAQACFSSPMRLEQVALNTVPGDGFKVLLSSTPVVGFGLYRRVYIAEAFVDDTLTWAHEFVHAMGVVGHPTDIFDRCGL